MGQIQLAERAGVDPKTIYNLEQGRTWPQKRTVAAIEEVLQWEQGHMEGLADDDAPRAQITLGGLLVAAAGEAEHPLDPTVDGFSDDELRYLDTISYLPELDQQMLLAAYRFARDRARAERDPSVTHGHPSVRRAPGT